MTQEASASAQSEAARINSRIAYGSAAALAVGSFLPWVKGTAAFVGTVSYSGIEGGDGIFTLAAAGLVFLLGLQVAKDATPSGNLIWGWIVLVVLAAILIYEINHISEAISGAPAAGVAVSYGAGIWLCVAGGVGMLVCLVRSSTKGE